MDTLIKDVTEIYRRVLKDPELELTPETTADDVPGWDSLNHTILMAEVQKHFQIKFTLKEVVRFRNVGDMMIKINERLKK